MHVFDAGQQKLLEKRGEELCAARSPLPWWASIMIEHREHFRLVAVAAESDFGTHVFPPVAFFVVLARQGSDPALRFVQGTLKQPPLPAYDATAAGRQSHSSGVHRNAMYEFGAFFDSRSIPLDADGNIVVLADCVHVASGATCLIAPIPFDEFSIALQSSKRACTADPAPSVHSARLERCCRREATRGVPMAHR